MHHMPVLFFVPSTSHVMFSVLLVISALPYFKSSQYPIMFHIYSLPKMSINSQKDGGSGCAAAMLGLVSLRSTLVPVIAFNEIWHPSGDSSDSQLFTWHFPDLVLLYPGAGTQKHVPLDVCCWRLDAFLS